MKAQFHLPLATYPDASSFSLLQNAVAVSLHQKAGLTASMPLVRIESFQPRFPSLLDVDKMRADAERLSKDNGTVLGQTLHDYARKAEVEVEIQPFDAREPFVAQTLAELSRAYDLSILEASVLMRPLIESVLFESGRPLLLFPRIISAAGSMLLPSPGMEEPLSRGHWRVPGSCWNRFRVSS